MSQDPVVPDGLADPGNAPPEDWSAPFDAGELAELLGVVDDPVDPLVVAGLAGTLYDDPALDEPAEPGGDGDGR